MHDHHQTQVATATQAAAARALLPSPILTAGAVVPLEWKMLASHDLTGAAAPRRPTLEELVHAHSVAGRKACMIMAAEGRSKRFLASMEEVDALADQILEMREPRPLPEVDVRTPRFLAGMCGRWS